MKYSNIYITGTDGNLMKLNTYRRRKPKRHPSVVLESRGKKFYASLDIDDQPHFVIESADHTKVSFIITKPSDISKLRAWIKSAEQILR